jgi:bacterioferritin-associated ferredoxin
MYVCNCTAISESKLKEILDDGAKTVGQVFKAHGKRAQCGKCASEIRDAIRDGLPEEGLAASRLNKWRERRAPDVRKDRSNPPRPCDGACSSCKPR